MELVSRGKKTNRSRTSEGKVRHVVGWGISIRSRRAVKERRKVRQEESAVSELDNEGGWLEDGGDRYKEERK